MKATPEQVARLRAECMTKLAALGVPPENVVTERNRWDLLSASGSLTWLYKAGLNDAHIDTAMRSIFPVNQTE